MKLAQHYRILGLRRSASFSDVKKAYRRLVRQCHPDINPNEAAIEQFIQINAAYTALCEALQQKENTEESTDSNSSAPNAPTRASESGVNGSNTGGSSASESKQQPVERLNIKDLKRTLEKLGLGNFQQADEPAESQSTQANTSPEPTTSATDSPPTASNKGVTNAATASSPESAEDVAIKKEAYDQLRDLLRQQKFPRAIALVEGLAHRLPTDTEINQWQAIVYQRWGRQLISQGQFHKAHLYLKKALQTDPSNPSLSNEVARDLGLLKHIQAAETTLSQP